MFSTTTTKATTTTTAATTTRTRTTTSKEEFEIEQKDEFLDEPNDKNNDLELELQQQQQQQHVPTHMTVAQLLRTSVTIGLWYIISSAIILRTKWLLADSRFPFPLTVTTLTNFITTIWALILSSLCSGRQSSVPSVSLLDSSSSSTTAAAATTTSNGTHSNLQHHHQQQRLSWKQFKSYVLPIGISTALEIGCSNLALKLLTVSFGTILKGGAPIFTFCWGIWFRVEQFSWSVASSLITIALGIALAAMGEGHTFVMLGFVLQVLSTALGGFRWAMTHVLLQGTTASTTTTTHSGTSTTSSSSCRPLSPLQATLYTAPTTGLCVMPFALWLEGHALLERMSRLLLLAGSSEGHDALDSNVDDHIVYDMPYDDDNSNDTEITSFQYNETLSEMDPLDDIVLTTSLGIVMWTLLGVGTLVFLLLISEYWLVHATSSLALSVASVFKELVTIVGGIIFFHEHVSELNVIGFILCQAGIGSYTWLRYEDKGTARTIQQQDDDDDDEEEEVIDLQETNSIIANNTIEDGDSSTFQSIKHRTTRILTKGKVSYKQVSEQDDGVNYGSTMIPDND